MMTPEQASRFQETQETTANSSLPREATPADAKLLAALYIVAYRSPPWNEEKLDQFELVEKNFQDWIANPSHRVMLFIRNQELVGFTVTRKEPANQVVQSITEEIKDVSGVEVDASIIRHSLQNKLGFDLDSAPDELMAGVFQDIVLTNSRTLAEISNLQKLTNPPEWLSLLKQIPDTPLDRRPPRDNNDTPLGVGLAGMRDFSCLIPEIEQILADPNVEIMWVYTRKGVRAIRRTLEKLGGVVIYDETQESETQTGEMGKPYKENPKGKDLLIVAAHTDVVAQRIKEFIK